MKAVLTDRKLKSLKPAPAGKRITIWDGATPAFGCRVTDKGAVSFFVMRRRAGEARPTRIVLGQYPSTSLSQAREKAAGALKLLAAGEHPREREAAQRRAAAERKADTFAAVAERFIAEHVRKKLRTAGEVERAIRLDLIPRWGERPIGEITRREVIHMVEELGDRGAYTARNTLAYARKLFKWAIAKDIVETSPCDHVRADDHVAEAESRDRVLTDDELRAVWQATAGGEYPLHPFIRLLLVTGARRNEVARMTWAEVDIDAATWTLAGSRTKGKELRVVPLPRLALDILRSLPRFAGPFVFSTTSGARPISGFAKFKARLDKQITALPADVAPWRLHDARRTMRSHLSDSRLGISPIVAELMIGHRQQGIRAVYDRFAYAAEQRAGFEAWCARLDSITGPKPGNVVAMRKAR